MTDPRQPGRIDLRAFDEPHDPLQAERIIQAALAEARLGTGILPWLAARWPRTVAAAAAILLAAMTLLRLAPEGSTPPVAPLATWISENRVPTNGEILTAFEGDLR
jgi:hypothetical protein